MNQSFDFKYGPLVCLRILFLLCFSLGFSRNILAQSGELIERTFSVEATTRSFKLYLPAAYDNTEALPLVINLHGFLSFPDQQVLVSQMNPVADTGQFLVAYPEGLEVNITELVSNNPFLTFEGGGWNLYGALSDNDDIAFISALIDEVNDEFPVQLERVYAAGMSMGGQMTYYLACELNDRIAAFASVTGDLPEEDIVDCIPERAVPILHVHGTFDRIAPFEGGITGRGVLPTIDFWLENNECQGDSVVVNFEDVDDMDGSTVILTSYEDCDAKAEVQFYQVNGGGHTWPGGMQEDDSPLFGNINQDISASSEIWNFFQQFTLSIGQSVGNRPLVPEDILLHVYPNPFTSILHIAFDLPETSSVKLELLNMYGQQIDILLDQQLGRGNHLVSWDVSQANIPTGVYYYRLFIDGRVLSKSLIHH